MKLKICGVRTPEMLRACQGGQVDFVGLNFVTDSKRRVLRLPEVGDGNRFKLVGVFRDASLDFILTIIKKAKLDIVQLHGSETPEFIKILQEHLMASNPDVLIWKALPGDADFEEGLLQSYCKNCDLIVFDGKNPGSGNTILDQEKLNESIFIVKTAGVKVGIAGGINADNIEEFRENFSKVFLLDVASGVEVDGDFSATETRRLIKNFNG